MAGAYCNYCDRRCFVDRVIPDGPLKGRSFHLATCPAGMAHDLKVTGHTHETAVNPILDPEAVERIAAEIAAVTAGGEAAMTLADRITSVLTGTGFRPHADMPFDATHYSGPFFTVAEGVGATVSVAWTDATDAERGAELHRYEIRLHEAGLSVERRDSYLYVSDPDAAPPVDGEGSDAD